MAVMLSPSTKLRVCELIGFGKNDQPQLFGFVEAKFAKLDLFSIFSQPLRINSAKHRAFSGPLRSRDASAAPQNDIARLDCRFDGNDE
jgi:hypothetical protein